MERGSSNLLRRGIKIVAIAASVYGLIRSYEFILYFSYFTVLANASMDVALAYFLYLDLAHGNGGAAEKSQGAYRFKFICTCAVVFTFLVYLTILGPTQEGGLIAAYADKGWASLCLHVVLPLLSLADYLMYDDGFVTEAKEAVWAIIAPLIYMAVILVMSLGFGVRWVVLNTDMTMSAPYNFLNFEAPTGWFGFDMSQMSPSTLGIGVAYIIIALCVVFLLLALLLLKAKGMRKQN